MLTSDQIKQYLNDIESDRIERTISINNTDKFCEAICAFANDIGNSGKPGYLFIGANNDGSLSGLQASDELLLNLAGIRSDGNILPQPALTVYKLHFPEGDVIVLEVQPSNFPPVRYKGKIWVRIGSRKAIANETEERLLIERRTANAGSFDARPCYGSKLQELKLKLFNAFYLPQAIDAKSLKSDKRNVKYQLASLRFFDLKNDCPTNAGMLLFGENPEYYFSGNYIQYVKFSKTTVASDIVNEYKFTGDMITVLNKLNNFIETGIVRKHPVPVSALREETQRNYPFWAIRELLMNAIMHRDYESNTPIKFYEYIDHLEIVNPGGLYGNARPENFPNVNDYRNPIIAEAMKVLGYVNRFNRGIIRVQEELKNNGNKKAVFSFNKITVFGVKVKDALGFLNKSTNGASLQDKVTDKVTDNLTENQIQIIRLMEHNAHITTKELSEKIKISQRKIKENISKLKDKDLIKRHGSAKSGHWEVIKKNKQTELMNYKRAGKILKDL